MLIYECATQEDAEKMFTFEFIEQNDQKVKEGVKRALVVEATALA